MNGSIKTILSFLAGGLIGSAIVYVVMHNKHKKDIEIVYNDIYKEYETSANNQTERIEELEKDIDTLRTFKSSTPIKEVNTDNITKEEAIDILKESSKNFNAYSSLINNEHVVNPIDYANIMGQSEEINELIIQQINKGIDPYVISRDDYINSCEYYSKEDYIWYQGDNVLVNQTNGPGEVEEESITNLIGDEFMDKFGELDPDEPDVVYVRNDILAIDFMIGRVDGSYYNEE